VLQQLNLTRSLLQLDNTAMDVHKADLHRNQEMQLIVPANLAEG